MKTFDPEKLRKRIKNGDVVLAKVGPVRDRHRHDDEVRPTSIERILVGIFRDDDYKEAVTERPYFTVSIGYTGGNPIITGIVDVPYRDLVSIEKLKKKSDVF